VLALVTMIGIFGEATGPLLNGFGQPYRNTFVELVQSLLIISFAWVLISRFGLVGAALAWLPAVSVSQFISAYFIQKILDQPFKGMHRAIFAVISITMISALIAYTTSSMVAGISGLILAGVLSVLSVVSLVWISDRRFSLGFIRNLASAFPQVAALFGISFIES
jgi:O-antigen/teichoic acid export membrane protein